MFGHVHDDMSTVRRIIPNMKKEFFYIKRFSSFMSEKIVHIMFPSFEKMDHAIPSVRYIAKKARKSEPHKFASNLFPYMQQHWRIFHILDGV